MSYLKQVFSVNNLSSCNPTLGDVSLQSVQQSFFNNDQLQTVKFSNFDGFENDNAFFSESMKIPMSPNVGLFELYCFKKYDNVSFKAPKYKVIKLGKYSYTPGQFEVKICIPPNEKFCVSTGYVLSIPPHGTKKDADGKITYLKQRLVLVPNIIAYGADGALVENFLPLTCGYDQSDDGEFKICGYSGSGVNKLTAVLRWYYVGDIESSLSVLDDEEGGAAIIKRKDTALSRAIKNLNRKFYADSLTVSDKDVLFECFCRKTGMKLEKQKLLIRDNKFLLLSRKREWFDESTITTPGVVSIDDGVIVVPNVIGDPRDNTHGIVFITNRCMAISLSVDIGEPKARSLKILNGFFSNDPNYKSKLRCMKRLVGCVGDLYKQEDIISNYHADKGFDPDVLLTIYDVTGELDIDKSNFEDEYKSLSGNWKASNKPSKSQTIYTALEVMSEMLASRKRKIEDDDPIDCKKIK